MRLAARLSVSAAPESSVTPVCSIRQHTSAYVSIGRPRILRHTCIQHTTAYVSIRQRQHTSVSAAPESSVIPVYSIRQHTSAYVSVSIRQYRPPQTPPSYLYTAYVSVSIHVRIGRPRRLRHTCICQGDMSLNRAY